MITFAIHGYEGVNPVGEFGPLQAVKYLLYSTLKDGQIRESLEVVDFGKLIR